jgi:hypothetical protein
LAACAGLARGRVRSSWTRVRFSHAAGLVQLFFITCELGEGKGKSLGRRGAAWNASRWDLVAPLRALAGLGLALSPT